MNFVFISPNYPSGHWKYVYSLYNKGVNVLGIGDAGAETFPAVLRGSMAEYYRVGDLHDYEAVYRACAFFIHKYGRIDFIESLNPYWRDLEAGLRSDYGINGITADRLDAVINIKKSFITAENAGVQTVPHRVLNSSRSAKNFAKRTGYPIKALPISNKHLQRIEIHDESEAEVLLGEKEKNTYMLCSDMAGEIMISLDGIADEDNNAVFCTASEFSYSTVKTTSGKELMSFCTVHSDRRINKLCKNLLGAFNQGRGFFHFEFIKTSEEYFLARAEFNPPAEYIADAMSCACGCSVYDMWAEMFTDGKKEFAKPEKCVVGTASRRFDRTYLHSHEDILNRLGAKLYDHRYNDDTLKDTAGEYIYIFRCGTKAEAKRHISFIQEQ